MEIILLILLVVVFLGLPIMSMRKQSKQINEIKSFQSQLEPGMIVQMTAGIHARIDEVGSTTVDVELAPGVVTTWDRSSVLKKVESPEDSVEASTGAPDIESIPDSPEGLDDDRTVRDDDGDSTGRPASYWDDKNPPEDRPRD
ncbi:MAG: preprotein translocase subunit YajC [Mycobacteriaceae bacterium]|uniref:preprotein translocase subunit YajC n=1 Tax=Corynebacterium sp. TaxID=1720 RepID=UPI003F9E1A74